MIVDEKKEKRKVTVIVPLGCISSGKSFVRDVLEKTLADREDWEFHSISSDAMRGEAMDKLIANNPKLTREKAFE